MRVELLSQRAAFFGIVYVFLHHAMNIIHTFLLGIGILLGAIILNSIATKLGVMTWYTFVQKPSDATLFSYIWLFMLYPLGLGTIAYIALRLMKML